MSRVGRKISAVGRNRLNGGRIESQSCFNREGRAASRRNEKLNSRAALCFDFGTTSLNIAAGSGLPGSCPKSGDLPKSPFEHRQRQCHRLAKFHFKKQVILIGIAGAVCTRGSVARAKLRAFTKRIFTQEKTMNNENLTLHLKVKDFNAWRTSYNGHEKERSAAGITNSKVFRSADDQNDIVILADAADVSKARSWLGSSEMKTVMEKSGVLGTPRVHFAAAA
jgi:hypothetical protein